MIPWLRLWHLGEEGASVRNGLLVLNVGMEGLGLGYARWLAPMQKSQTDDNDDDDDDTLPCCVGVNGREERYFPPKRWSPRQGLVMQTA